MKQEYERQQQKQGSIESKLAIKTAEGKGASEGRKSGGKETIAWQLPEARKKTTTELKPGAEQEATMEQKPAEEQETTKGKQPMEKKGATGASSKCHTVLSDIVWVHVVCLYAINMRSL